ncbi:oxidoreductase AflX [Achaetomium macrosporum]|uniref:Oxidoreductase AflX n=1 Tax=Achaetomium macrosporum TaxID=79813 RepID=A0AAN7H7X7_9PEZI|nr:oxidoreductase AflX [Achaetomium macrosporum]
MTSTNTYAVLGATGNTGTALIRQLLKKPEVRIHAYCRNRAKLLRLVPEVKVEEGDRVRVFEGSIHESELITSCIRGCKAVLLVVSTNDNIPGCRMAQDTALAVVRALRDLGAQDLRSAHPTHRPLPRVVLLSSASLDEQLSRKLPYLARLVLHRAASNVYHDIAKAEEILRAEADWLTAVYVKPGALSHDIQRGHALSFTDESGPLSFLDLAAAMIEAADDERGLYDGKSVGVVAVNGTAKFPWGTPWAIVLGLLRHYFPWLHPYLPMNSGP